MCLQLVMPIDVHSLVSNSLSVPEHNQQLLDMASAGAAIVISAWELAAGANASQQAAIYIVSGIQP